MSLPDWTRDVVADAALRDKRHLAEMLAAQVLECGACATCDGCLGVQRYAAALLDGAGRVTHDDRERGHQRWMSKGRKW